MSWSSSGSDEPPPKPLRYLIDNCSSELSPAPVEAYIVANNPEVCTQITFR